MSKKKKKGLSTNAKWGIALLVEIPILALMILLFIVVYLSEKYVKVQYEDLKEEDIVVNDGANVEQEKFTQIALFGIDARDNTSMKEGNRTDSIIIASINNETHEVKLVSIYRDSLLEIADGSNLTTKVNAAYAYGGPKLAIDTLNANLDLHITKFVTVNFLALTMAIDDLGGINIDVHENELPVLNSAISEQINITGIYSDGVWSSGEQLLNGTQATAYARVRSTDQGDITRTERQRTVISKMLSAAKHSDLATVNDIIDDVAPNVCTNLTKDEMFDLAKELSKFNLSSTAGFPFVQTPVNHPNKGAILVPADLVTNVSALHLYLFGTENYVPSSNVQRISSNIQNETGVAPKPIDFEIGSVPAE